jgi:DNA (cytosine-5)-methyltransferase 1
MRAIDLYSGVGGWSCGLQMCGVEIVKSYEIDRDAIKTNQLNSGHDCVQCDILQLDLDSLPKDIDIVVGSPPCTQFSFSNRGGQGNLEKGLQHIQKFLEVVDYLKPRWWVMENVPRTIKIVRECFSEGGAFHKFAHLQPQFFKAKAELFGTPQRRRRALIGNIDFNALARREMDKFIPLEAVVEAISESKTTVADPVYGFTLPRSSIADLAIEENLDAEEERINRSLKTSHHIYNKMNFPENEKVPARTLTATCTRVSRESIVVRDRRDPSGFRRLSIRERASLQGFPITYEFYAKSYGGKIKQIGNAIPPTLSFAVGCVMTGYDSEKTGHASSIVRKSSMAVESRPAEYTFERKRVYTENRSYRFAIDGYNFGSGVRFELTNKGSIDSRTQWECKFWFGTAKKILELPLNHEIVSFLDNSLDLHTRPAVLNLEGKLKRFDGIALQRVWSHRGPAGLHPFQLSDILTEHGLELRSEIAGQGALQSNLPETIFREFGPDPAYSINPRGKLAANVSLLLSGLYICSKFNVLVSLPSIGFADDQVWKAL